MSIATIAIEKLRQMPTDEPVFVLRAQDLLAADVVRIWADRAAEAGVNDPKVAEARAWADVMDAWVEKRLPD